MKFFLLQSTLDFFQFIENILNNKIIDIFYLGTHNLMSQVFLVFNEL